MALKAVVQVVILKILVEFSRIFLQVSSHLYWRANTLFPETRMPKHPFFAQSLGCYLEPMEISATVSISKRSLKANIKDVIAQGTCKEGKVRPLVVHVQENI